MASIYEDIKIEVEGSLKVIGDERLLRDMFFILFNISLEWGARYVWVGYIPDFSLVVKEVYVY